MTIPKISIVIPTHNRPDGLEQAVESVLQQTFLPIELIVVDDGSEPPVTDKIFINAPDGVRTILLRNKRPLGAAITRNKGVENANGDWVAFLDDDDTFFPEKLERIVNVIKLNPDVDLIYHPAMVHLVNEKITYLTKPGVLNDVESNFINLLTKNEIGGTSMICVRRDEIIAAGCFSKEFIPIEDYELYLRLAHRKLVFYFCNLPLTHYYFNRKKSSLTKRIDDRNEAMRKIEVLYANYYQQFDQKRRKEQKVRNLRAGVYNGLLCLNKSQAFRMQIKVLKETLQLRDFLLLFLIPFGTWFVFKLRSVS